MSQWTEHAAKWGDCQRCPLAQQRDRICLARGTVPADIVFVGEAPGASEDAIGQPFVGPAGKLLDEIVVRSVGHTSSKCGIPHIRLAWTNLVCCFPREAKARGDNEPADKEIEACEPRLIEFVNLCRPKLIVCVGALAVRWIDHEDTIKCVDIDHPAYILRMPLAQRQMALQRAVVILRNAVEDVLQSNQEFQEWRNGGHASSETSTDRLRREFTEAEERDIPF